MVVPLRCHPAFAAIADRVGTQHQVLDQEVLVSLETRPDRRRYLQYLFLDPHPRRRLATSLALATSRRFRRGCFVHPARFDVRAAFQALQPRDLLALLGDDPFEIRHLGQKLHHKLLQLASIGRRSREGHSQPA